jgi:CDP-diacylglycerol--glycerol-3-phosphate 3-phosphatidyltransferase
MNLATKITFVRILLVPIFLVLMICDTLVSQLLALGIFILGGITDTIDGMIARKQNSVTKIGISFDPLADKLLITTALICFLGFKQLSIPAWTVVIIVIRDYLITWVRSLNYDQPIPADKTAKIKTILQNVVVISIMLILSFEKQLHNFGIDKITIKIYPRIAMIFLSLFTLISGIVYIVKYRKYIMEQFRKN